MKKNLFIFVCLFLTVFCVNAADKNFIKVTTDGVELVFQVGPNGRLYQSYLGKPSYAEADYKAIFGTNIADVTDEKVKSIH